MAPDEVARAWLAKESVRYVYLADTTADATVLLDKTITGCLADEVPEIVTLGETLRRWRTEILARHDTGASNGRTKGLNLWVKKETLRSRVRSFEHYRLPVLLHAGGVTLPARPQPPRIRPALPTHSRRA